MSALHTNDPEAATVFYGDVFGWTAQAFMAGSDRVTLYRLPGYVGGKPEQPVPRDVVAVMTQIAGSQATTPHWGVDFWIDDADAAVARAQRLGATVVGPPYDTPTFRQAVIVDPAGATFSISQLRQ